MDKQNEQHHEDESGYLFNVEVLIRSKTNGQALQNLLQLLNNGPDIMDFRINSGIELGEIIDSLLANRKQSFISKTYKRLGKTEANNNAPDDGKQSKPQPKAEAPVPDQAASGFKDFASSEEFQKWIQSYITGNKLVRLYINRNGERMSIPCRILNFLPETYALNVYHVDEKQVYNLKLSEIIDFLDT
ncbi:MAG: hypothetical protein E7L01_22950 [Paenibacillus macerans]|uniref:Uncharacterized protein n=1 Tax=Paenibacillus macerans TaxID=44252 RepID=A0A090Y5P1_PAEMA|nr:hypothetical protein [Paenibacillus macerans]KFM93137.1 hypothetical protein DJ90_3011 [Paenibacillus macerans]MBS5913419.1 hypothetical protein [Paenibacillus macerans]MCY7557341.1 hypothetical protein [Paenibacillus macerans]MDU7476171.1 hypothetical protein [Paenibacillus macerans]MEC0141252.1 hypothetical protein [Paenibacillus macerans]